MAEQDANRQIVFLSEGSKRTRGREAQQINILIARAIAEAVKSTLGPKGMDKMIVDDLGDIIISNDGATILDEMSIDHPVGKMLVDVAKTQEAEVGDGTTTAVVLAGGLLEKAEKLLDDEIHPSIIIKGYRHATKKAIEILNKISDSVNVNDKKMLTQIAMTSMTGKSAEAEMKLASMVVDSVLAVMEEDNGRIVIDKDMIKIETKQGASLAKTEMINGIVIDKEVVHSGMPKHVKNAKIALVDAALEIKETETDAEIRISDPEQLQAFLDKEESLLKEMVENVSKSGANVLMCQKGIDDLAQHFLSKNGILAIRRVKKSDMEKIAKATGASIVTRLSDISKTDLGQAKDVSEKKIGDEEMLFIEGCKNPKSVTILVRGGSQHVVEEAERSIDDALGTVSSVLRDKKSVSGGGSTEIELAMQLRKYATSVGGREQLAIEAFAETLEVIPRTLAETAGRNPLDTIVDLKSKHKGEKGKYIGVNVYSGKLEDMKKEHVIEPLSVKTQAITSASEVAEMVLRIDDIIKGTGSKAPPMGPEGMPPGMPPMGM